MADDLDLDAILARKPLAEFWSGLERCIAITFAERDALLAEIARLRSVLALSVDAIEELIDAADRFRTQPPGATGIDYDEWCLRRDEGMRCVREARAATAETRNEEA